MCGFRRRNTNRRAWPPGVAGVETEEPEPRARPGSGSDDGDEFAGKRQIRTGTSARDPARAGAAPGKEGLLTPISKWLWDEDK